MAASFDFQEDNGAATGSPAKGTTRTTGRTECNHKSIDDTTTAFTAAPIKAGQNSYQKNLFGVFTGTFHQILNVRFAHTAGSTGSNVLKGVPACTTSAGPYAYVTPSQSTDANLTQNMSAVTAIGSGVAVWLSATGPEASGKAVSCTSNPCYTNWLTTQLQVNANASSGNSTQLTLGVQWDEN